MNIQETIEKVKQKDQAAFEELYNQYYQMGFALALQFVKNDEDAMDIIQETFLTVNEKINMLDDADKFKSWYMQIVANKCRDFLKKKNPLSFTEANAYDEDGNLQFEIEDDSREFQPQEAVDYTETTRIVEGMLDNLPEDQKMCLILYFVNEMKISEIAEALNISEATVKSRLKYGKDKLRVQVEEYEKQNGTKLRGFVGVSLVPFIKWMLGKKAASVPNVAATIAKPATIMVAQELGKTVAKKASKGLFKKIAAMSLGQKVVSSVVAVAIVAGGTTAAVVTSNKSNDADSSNSTADYVNSEHYDDTDYKNSNDNYIDNTPQIELTDDLEEINLYDCIKEYIYCEGYSGYAFIDVDLDLDQAGRSVELEPGVRLFYSACRECEYVERCSDFTVYIYTYDNYDHITTDLHFYVYAPNGSKIIMCDETSIFNGDEITIQLSPNEVKKANEQLKQYGYFIKETEFAFVVSGLEEYITSADQMTDEIIDAYWAFIESEMDNYDLTDAIDKSMYLITDKTETEDLEWRCILWAIYVFENNKGTYDYVSVEVDCLRLTQDGKIFISEYDNWIDYEKEKNIEYNDIDKYSKRLDLERFGEVAKLQ